MKKFFDVFIISFCLIVLILLTACADKMVDTNVVEPKETKVSTVNGNSLDITETKSDDLISDIVDEQIVNNETNHIIYKSDATMELDDYEYSSIVEATSEDEEDRKLDSSNNISYYSEFEKIDDNNGIFTDNVAYSNMEYKTVLYGTYTIISGGTLKFIYEDENYLQIRVFTLDDTTEKLVLLSSAYIQKDILNYVGTYSCDDYVLNIDENGKVTLDKGDSCYDCSMYIYDDVFYLDIYDDSADDEYDTLYSWVFVLNNNDTFTYQIYDDYMNVVSADAYICDTIVCDGSCGIFNLDIYTDDSIRGTLTNGNTVIKVTGNSSINDIEMFEYVFITEEDTSNSYSLSLEKISDKKYSYTGTFTKDI